MVSGHSDGLADILSIVVVLAVEHWVCQIRMDPHLTESLQLIVASH